MPPDKKAKAPAWLPDWRDASKYPQQLTDRDWRWQFLRRHPDYQALWERPCDASFVHSIAISGNREITTRDQDRLAEFKQQYPSAQILRALYIDEAEDFGVRSILDPALPGIPRAIMHGFWTTAVELEWREFSAMFAQRTPPSAEQWTRWQDQRRAGLVATVFDLRFDLDKQLDRGFRKPTRKKIEGKIQSIGPMGWLRLAHKRRAFAKPPARSNDQPHLWSTYLRVLDGRTAGATWAAISRELRLLSDVQVKTGIKPGPKARQTWDAARAILFRLSGAN